MRRNFAFLAVGILILGLGAGVVLYDQLFRDGGIEAESVRFSVERGWSLGRVAEELADAQLLAHPWQLRLVARIEGGSRRIRAGDYLLPRGASPARLLHELVEGRLQMRSLTVPEGWRLERTLVALSDSLGQPIALLDSLARNPSSEWRDRLDLPPGVSLEGYLVPETYHFVRGTPGSRLLETMLDGLAEVFDATARARADSMGWSIHQVLTLASIVEAEAVIDDERARVAAVYHNRLRKGWKLEADPTVAFALRKEGERLTFADLEVDSPYNTYRNAGLPPGPINSPGRASILATLEPEPGFDAMYFVADGTGRHRFSRTWDEHRAAVQEYRRWQRQQRAAGGSG